MDTDQMEQAMFLSHSHQFYVDGDHIVIEEPDGTLVDDPILLESELKEAVVQSEQANPFDSPIEHINGHHMVHRVGCQGDHEILIESDGDVWIVESDGSLEGRPSFLWKREVEKLCAFLDRSDSGPVRLST